ncbi:adenosylcobinamide-GDP ribazoletransferase [Spiractinospora alimapuensis]|uniref:adenosylcobinamide-GDP ribazoletransferase n=1 Tax=Spiractinospora alimapuensis TaxID=2820884 RepID=UPI001F2431E5|nr:adenosylcobinamide-GDP ribazoletransferase [Spiractinospora alimapuensis]QVQ53255.1 adenosylcobinamide-GDP ribazoletransferase [Spiractinospora alimapuensis]
MNTLESLGQGLRTAVGTLTVFPVGAARWDRATMRWAMALAPVPGLVLGVAGAVLLWGGLAVGASPAVAALLSVGALALLTRGLHLDGLADLADGLGSARPASGALEVMRRSDIGPFGVITLIVVLGLQVACLIQLADSGHATAAVGLVVAVLAGRLAITWACRTGVPSARPEGLGAMVSSVLPWTTVALSSTVVVLASWSLGLVGPWNGLWAPLSVVAGVAAAEGLRWHAVRRLGGITGDVLGAVAETGATVTLVVAALLLA